MLKLLSTLIMMSSFVTLFSQTQYTTETIEFEDVRPSDWVVYFEDNQNFKIEYKLITCDYTSGYDQEMVLLKVTNLSTENIKFFWHAELHYAAVCKTCNDQDEYTFGTEVPSGQSVEGVCDRSVGFDLKFFSGFNDVNYKQGEHLTAFKLGTLTTETTE